MAPHRVALPTRRFLGQDERPETRPPEITRRGGGHGRGRDAGRIPAGMPQPRTRARHRFPALGARRGVRGCGRVSRAGGVGTLARGGSRKEASKRLARLFLRRRPRLRRRRRLRARRVVPDAAGVADGRLARCRGAAATVARGVARGAERPSRVERHGAAGPRRSGRARLFDVDSAAATAQPVRPPLRGPGAAGIARGSVGRRGPRRPRRCVKGGGRRRGARGGRGRRAGGARGAEEPGMRAVGQRVKGDDPAPARDAPLSVLPQGRRPRPALPHARRGLPGQRPQRQRRRPRLGAEGRGRLLQAALAAARRPRRPPTNTFAVGGPRAPGPLRPSRRLL
mmetsp:Transcript_17506/g.59107  ORF Transcript_17506/g.59107 Transcript_17506/m.59107 type:complete len:339 (-) Transcript_17506:367-1383(-)